MWVDGSEDVGLWDEEPLRQKDWSEEDNSMYMFRYALLEVMVCIYQKQIATLTIMALIPTPALIFEYINVTV